MTTAVETREGQAHVTCDDCFFRRAELCALPGNTPCPTFRATDGGPRTPRPALVAVASGPRAAAAA